MKIILGAGRAMIYRYAMNIHWLLRAKRLAQNPPSWGRVKFFFYILLFCILLFALERYFGWPEWLTTNNLGHRGVPRF